MNVPMNNTTIYTLSFADNRVIVAQDFDDLKYMTRKPNEKYNIWCLEVNTSKTYVATCA